MSKKCTIYIDEAGDLGIGRGTQWFILSGVIVNEEDEHLNRSILQSIKTRLDISNIHFRNLRGFEQKSFVIKEISKCKFEYINIIIDTSKITLHSNISNNSNNKPSFITYNFACRLLIERASWLLRDTDRIAKIILSSRGTNRDKELIDYIQNKLFNYEFNQISNRFTSVESKPAASWDLLQLADICATSMFYYHEPNSYGFITPCYNYVLKKFLYHHNGAIDKYGVKYYSSEMKPDMNYFKDKMLCKQ